MSRPDKSPRPRGRTVVAAAGFLLLVFGAKLAFLDRAGSDLPIWDQWNADAANLLVPWLRGELGLDHLLAAHNEHRIAATRLLNLALVALGGQWDPLVQCVANALLQSLVALGIFLWGRRLVPSSWQPTWWACTLVLFGSPIAWENALSGFHTQQTLLTGFSLAGIGLLLSARPLAGSWWMGFACLVSALGTMASGLLAAAAVVATLLLTTPWREVSRRHGWTLLVCALTLLVAVATRVHVPAHDALRAHSVAAFVASVWKNLHWPATDFPLYPLIAGAPFVWLLARVWRLRGSVSPDERIVCGVGLWVLLQIAATAYARGGPGDGPANRYLDVLVIGIAVNVATLYLFFRYARFHGWKRPLAIAGCIVGLAGTGAGLWHHIRHSLEVAVPDRSRTLAQMAGTVRAYANSGDDAILSAGPIPHSTPALVADVMSDLDLRGLLPAGIRAALPLAAASEPFVDRAAVAADPATHPPRGWPLIGIDTPTAEPGETVWRSGLVPVSKLPYWALPVLVPSDSGAVRIALVAEDGRTLSAIAPAMTEPLPDSAWRLALVPAPRVPARVVVHAPAGSGRIGIGAPVEVSALSRAARRLIGASAPLIGVGMCLLFGTGATSAVRHPGGAPGPRILRSRLRTMPRWQVVTGMILGAIAAFTAVRSAHAFLHPAYFEARVSGDLARRSMEVFYDRGHGIRGSDAVQVWFGDDERERRLHLRLNGRMLHKLRIDPIDHGGTLVIEDARIVDASGAVLRVIAPSQFSPLAQIAALQIDGNRLTVTSEPGALDSQMLVRLDPTLETTASGSSRWPWLVMTSLAALGGLAAGPFMLGGLVAVVSAWVLRCRAHLAKSRDRNDVATDRGRRAETVLVAAIVLVGILALRKPDAFTNPQLWAEDATVLHAEAEAHGLASLLRPYAGYLHLVPRLGAYVASFVDPLLLPTVHVALSLCVLLGCTLHLFSRRMPLPWAPAMALAIALVPHTGEVYLNLINTQWLTALLVVQLAMKADARTARDQALDCTLAVLAGLSGPFCVLLLPLFLWRTWARRTSGSAILGAVVSGCAAVQSTLIFAFMRVSRSEAPGMHVLDAAAAMGRRWVSDLFLGAGATQAHPWLAMVTAAVVLVLLIAFTWRSRDFRDVKLILWIAALTLLAASLFRARLDLWAFDQIANGDRYFFVPKVLLLWLLILHARAPAVSGWVARAALVWIAAANLSVLRTSAEPDMHWEQHCDAIRRGEPAEIPITPSGWIYHYPGRLRGDVNPHPAPEESGR